MAKSQYQLKIDATIDLADVEAKLRQLQEKYKTLNMKATATTAKGGGVGVATGMGAVVTETTKATKATKSWGSALGDTFKKVAYFGAVTAGIQLATQGMRSMIDQVRELDASLTELKKVSNLSGEGLKAYAQQAGEVGLTVGRTASEMVDASTSFVKSGYSEQQALQLAEVASKFQNVADSEVEAGDAANFIISQMKAFGIEATNASRVIDVVNEVSNKYAVSSTDLSTALSKTASAMAAGGNSYEETIGLYTAGVEIMQNQASKVGRGLRTMTANIVQAANNTGTLEYSVKGASKSLSLFDETTGDVLSTYEVFGEIAKDWKDMSDAEKESLAISIAGKNHLEVFSAVMSNFQTAINATEDGLYSMGSASRENEKYMDSIEGKLSGLSSAWQKFSTDLISSDFVKGAVSGLTGFLNVLDQIPIKTIAVGAGISALVLNFANIAKGISTFAATVKGAILPLQAFISTVALMKDSKGLFGAITLATETTATSLAPLIASLTTLAPVLAGLAAFAGLSAIIDATTVSLEEQEQAVTDVTGKLENLKGEYDALASSPSLSASDQARLKSLEAQITANEQILKQEKEKLAYQKFGEGSRPQTKGFLTEGGTVDQPSGAEKLKSQAKQLQSDIKAYKDLDKQIANTDKNSKDYAKTVQDLSDKQDKLKSSIDEQAASMIPVADEFRELYDAGVITGDEYVELMGILDDVVGAYNELGQSSAEAMSGDTATPWAETTERIKEATNAINEYHKALQENPERNQEFKSYADAWHTLNQEIQNGTTSSVAFRESAKFLFGEDWVNSVRYSADAIGERAKQTGVLFETAESNGMGLITALKNLADESGNVKNAMGETIATISDADGQLTFDIPKQNLAELAEMLGTTEDGLTSLMHGLEMYGGTAMFGDISDYVNQAKEYGTALDGVGDSAGKSLVNLKQFEQEMINAKVPADQAMDTIDRLASSDAVIDIGVDPSSTNAVEQAEAKLDELGVTIDTMNGKELNIDVQSLVELGQTMGLTDIQIVQLAENFGLAQEAANQLGTVSFDATTSSLEKIMPSANKVQKALDKLGKTKSTAKLDAKDSASKKISDVLSKVRNLAKQKASVSITAKDNASSVISTIKSKLDSLKDKIVKVTTQQTTTEGGSITNSHHTQRRATGDSNFMGGRVLVGEEYSPNGTPKPELIVAHGQAYLAGQKGPEILNLPRGAQIFSNTDTQKILNSNTFKTIPAFDGGTISLQQYQTATGTSYPSTGSNGSSGSRGSSGSGTSATNKETSAQKNLAKATNDANEALENQKKIYDEEIDILDHQLFLMGKNKDAYADQVAQVQTILKKLEEQANWYRSQGEKEESKYIRELQKQWKQNTTFIQ